jgi:hypothetical protein
MHRGIQGSVCPAVKQVDDENPRDNRSIEETKDVSTYKKEVSEDNSS